MFNKIFANDESNIYSVYDDPYMQKCRGNYLTKKVTFSQRNNVYIIQNNDDYVNDKCNLWWSVNDINSSKNSSYAEIIKFISIYPYLNFKDARKIIYHSENDNLFN